MGGIEADFYVFTSSTNYEVNNARADLGPLGSLRTSRRRLKVGKHDTTAWVVCTIHRGESEKAVTYNAKLGFMEVTKVTATIRMVWVALISRGALWSPLGV